MDRPDTVTRWHEVVAEKDPDLLDALLADDAVFRSPAVHTPQEGRALTTTYLRAALKVLGPTLAYQREWYDGSSAVLEFTAELDGLTVHGVDMFRWDDSGRITEFTVMVRPFKGLQKVMEHMITELVPKA